jgi:phage terminase large subunit-like protein
LVPLAGDVAQAVPSARIALTAWDCSCPDWADRILHGRSLVPDLPLNRALATKALGMFKRLRLPDVIGTPRLRDVGADWIFDIVEALFGSYDPQTDRRHIQELFLLVPKKNGKSSYSAGIMVTAILMNRRPEAEFMLLAPTIEVAQIAFRQARGIIRADPLLTTLFHIQDNLRTITYRRSNARLQIKAADVDVVTGAKALGTLVDETHVFAEKYKAADIFTELRGSLAARPDGFLIQITTQSKAPPAGIFKSELQRARDVRDGKLKLPKPLLPVLYELPPSRDWRDEKNWPLVNPNLGRSVDAEFLRSSLIDADRKGRGDLALFASQHFNVEIGLSLRSDHWAGAEFWERATDPELDLERLLDQSETVVVGIDGGGLDDLFGLAVLGRAKETKDWLCWSHAWCHRGVLQRRQTIASALEDFAARRELTIVDDELADISEIVAIVADIKDRGLLASVAVDPAGIGEFVDALAEIRVTPEAKNIIGAPQGYQLMNAIKTCERKLLNGTLRHSGSELMAWCVGNLKIEPTATAIRATKQNAGDAKIDAVMALFNAATVMWQVKPAPEYQMIFA